MRKAAFPCRQLSELCSVISDGTHRTPIYTPFGIHFISVKDVREWEISFDDTKFISDSEHAILAKRCSPVFDDILLTKIGTIGLAAMVHESAPTFDIFVSVALLRIRPNQASPRFVTHYLNADLARKQFERVAKGIGVPDLHLEDIATTLIPTPPIKRQLELVEVMDRSWEERRTKLADADALLMGFDDFVIKTLGLTSPPKDDRKVFAATVNLAREQSHFNADYFHPERIIAIRAMEAASARVPCAKLADVVDFIRDQIKTPGGNYLSLANIQSHTGELLDAKEEAAGACSLYKTGDVLFARLRPYLNKVYCAEMNGCCSPEFHVLRVKNSESLRPDYLSAILRSSLTLAQTRHMMTGNTHPRLTNEDVINLTIPIPKKVAVQETIAVEARRRREEARRLRTQAEAGWQAAKYWFEKQLLGTK